MSAGRTAVAEADELTKACVTCAGVFPLTGFHRDRQRKDGRMNDCAACANRKRLKWRYENLEKAQASFRNWYKTHVAENSAKCAAYQARNPEKTKARSLLNNAVKRGKMARLPCEVCGDPRSQGHHEDHSKPLEVRWMCARCHGKEHRTSPEGVAAREQGR
jgi:hypothetical protein